MLCVNNKHAEQPAHLQILISSFVVNGKESIIVILASSKFQDSSKLVRDIPSPKPWVHVYSLQLMEQWTRPQGFNTFSCSTQLIMKIIMLIKRLKYHAQLNWAWKKCYSCGASFHVYENDTFYIGNGQGFRYACALEQSCYSLQTKIRKWTITVRH